MLSTIAAEWVKLVRHRATWGLVWIFPIGLTLLFLGFLAWELGHGRLPHVGPPTTAGQWIFNTTFVWKLAGSGPARCLIGAFTALTFGGEYGWNTWKLIAPHRNRVALIGAKYLVVLGLFLAAFVAMAVVTLVFSLVSAALTHSPLPDGITAGDLLAAHGKAALPVLLSTLLTMGYGSAAAVVFRSSMAGTITAVAAVILEGLAGGFASLLNRQFFLTLPTYHLDNLTAWIGTGRGHALPSLAGGVTQWGWQPSLAVLAAWIAGLIALATSTFQRQDLN